MNVLRTFGLCLLGLLLTASIVTGMTLKIATIAPEGSYWITEMRKATQTIKQRTDGRVKFKFYPGGVMGGERNVLRKIRLGQLQGGMFTGGGLESVYSDVRLYSLPLLFNNLDEVDYVRERLDGPLRAGLERAGFVSFGFAEGGFAQLMSKTPIRTLADMNGRKVWVPEGDRVYYESMSALGLSPVSLPITDVLTGLQTGLVEIVGTSPIGTLVLQWQTKIAYLTTTPLTYLLGVFVIDKRAFDKVREEDRRVVREVIEPLFVTFSRRNRIDNREALAALRAQGIKIIDQTPAAADEFRRRTRKAIDKLANEGFFERELLRQLEAHLADYRRSNNK